MWIVPGGIVPSLREIAERFKLDSSVVDRLFTW
jgi:DNA-binding transcriptional regulator YhcF (GntR family)